MRKQKVLFTSLLFFSFSFVCAQTIKALGQVEYVYKVAYQVENNTDTVKYSTSKTILTFSTTVAMYTRIFNQTNKSIKYRSKEDSALVANNKKIKDYVEAEIAKIAPSNLNLNGETISLQKYGSSILTRQEAKPGLEKYLIIDTLPKIDWHILEEKKVLLNYTCQKAIGKFRGRNYTAWFTTEIPIPTGPWKLLGLPGIILAANDDKNEVLFEAYKIEVPPTILVIIPDKLDGIEITNNKFIEISTANFKKIQAKNEAMLKATGGSYTTKFGGITVLMELTKN
jgi:GLPGLI family protein